MKRIATVHVLMDVEGETEEQLLDIVRNRVLGAGMRISLFAPSHAVSGIRLDVPMLERQKPSCPCGQPDAAHCDQCGRCPEDPHDEACGW
jgi:hypothetical protein